MSKAWSGMADDRGQNGSGTVTGVQQLRRDDLTQSVSAARCYLVVISSGVEKPLPRSGLALLFWMETAGSSTPQNDSLCESFCSGRNDRAIRGHNILQSVISDWLHGRGRPVPPEASTLNDGSSPVLTPSYSRNVEAEEGFRI